MADDAGNPIAQVLGRLGLSGDLMDTFSPSGDQLGAQRVQVEATDRGTTRGQ